MFARARPRTTRLWERLVAMFPRERAYRLTQRRTHSRTRGKPRSRLIGEVPVSCLASDGMVDREVPRDAQ